MTAQLHDHTGFLEKPGLIRYLQKSGYSVQRTFSDLVFNAIGKDGSQILDSGEFERVVEIVRWCGGKSRLVKFSSLVR